MQDTLIIKNDYRIAYFLWMLCLVGICGVHRIYTRHYILGILYLLTFGLFGIGQLVDLFLMPNLIDDKNRKIKSYRNSSNYIKFSNRHGRLQSKIHLLLAEHGSHGELYINCSIKGRNGTRVADVAWSSQDFFEKYQTMTPLPVAPEICVSMLSPSQYSKQIQKKSSSLNGLIEEKVDPFIVKGTQEVWLCDYEGNITVYTSQGLIEYSHVLKTFPKKVL